MSFYAADERPLYSRTHAKDGQGRALTCRNAGPAPGLRSDQAAKVAELVDALDLGSSGATRESSSLSFRTIGRATGVSRASRLGMQGGRIE